MSPFLTIIDRFLDGGGVVRYEYVSWPVYRDGGTVWQVKDVDGTWFDVPKSKALEDSRPCRLANHDMAQHMCNKYDDGIVDYNKAYKERLGIDQQRNTTVPHAYGALDVEKKKEMINGKDYGKNTNDKETRSQDNERNLHILPDGV